MNAVRLNDFAAVSHLRYPNVNVFEKYSPLNGVENERYECLHENDHFAIQSRPRFERYSLLVYMWTTVELCLCEIHLSRHLSNRLTLQKEEKKVKKIYEIAWNKNCSRC